MFENLLNTPTTIETLFSRWSGCRNIHSIAFVGQLKNYHCYKNLDVADVTILLKYKSGICFDLTLYLVPNCLNLVLQKNGLEN